MLYNLDQILWGRYYSQHFRTEPLEDNLICQGHTASKEQVGVPSGKTEVREK